MLIRGYINLQPCDINHVYVLRTETGTKNGDVKTDDLAEFCCANELNELCLYGPTDYTEGIKKKLDKELKTKFSYNNCKVYLAEEEKI